MFKEKEMARTYKKTHGSRNYRAYTDSSLQAALNDIRHKGLPQRVAAVRYNIPRSTLKNKLKGAHNKAVGGQTVFTPEEKLFEHTIVMSNFGFPVDTFDLRMIVKSYIDRRGLAIRQFQNNYLVLIGQFLS